VLNPGVERSAKQRSRYLVPAALRAPAPAHADRYVSPSATDISLRAAIGHVDACKRILVDSGHSSCTIIMSVRISGCKVGAFCALQLS
jgi:hypothetical protein